MAYGALDPGVAPPPARQGAVDLWSASANSGLPKFDPTFDALVTEFPQFVLA